MKLPGIEYVSYGQQVGYAIASVNYLNNLIELEPDMVWKTIIQDEYLKFGMEPAFYQDLPEKLKSLIDSDEHEVDSSHQIIHTTPEHFPALIKKQMQNIAMTVWETDRLPVNWIPNFNGIDKIIVPSSWNVDMFNAAGLKQLVYKLPHISQFGGEENKTNALNIPEDTFVFLNISVWERRKNLDALVKAYFKAFNSKDDVVLIIKTSKRDVSAPFYKIGRKKKYIKTKNKVRLLNIRYGLRNARIIVIPHNLSAEEMKSLYTRANAYVSLCHSEGWGMGLFESAWYGKPVITTDYSGYLDFLKPDNSFLIKSKMVDVIPNEWESNNIEGHQWAEPDLDAAIEQMRYVYNNYEAAKRRGGLLKEFVAKNFSPAQITNSFADIIKA